VKTNIGSQLQHLIAMEFADWIHGVVVNMQLRASFGIHPTDTDPSIYTRQSYQEDRIKEIRAFVRGIRDPFTRRIFIHQVGYLFKALRARRGTHPKYQDYVASVRANVATMQKEAA